MVKLILKQLAQLQADASFAKQIQTPGDVITNLILAQLFQK